MSNILHQRILRLTFVCLVFCSFLLQFLGAFAYAPTNWNKIFITTIKIPGQAETIEVPASAQVKKWLAKGGKVLKKQNLDIDLQQNRYRLWSFRDSPIIYYLFYFQDAREEKQRAIERIAERTDL
jgi:hypothetical protein